MQDDTPTKEVRLWEPPYVPNPWHMPQDHVQTHFYIDIQRDCFPMNTTPTETPRTDAEIRRASHSDGSGGEEEWEYVEPDVARQLERELTASQAQVTALREAIKKAADFEKSIHVGGLSVQQFDLWEASREAISTALSTPPPPVVPREDAENLWDALNCTRHQLVKMLGDGGGYAPADNALATFRAKHPLDTEPAITPAP